MIHKDNCTIYTPTEYVHLLLNSIFYCETHNLHNSKILEFSCGEGAILSEIVKRYVLSCKSHNISNKNIIIGLNRDIIAYEIDELVASRCENYINEILEKEFELFNVKFSVRKGDFLLTYVEEKFEFIVGNPPYISYHTIMANPNKYSLDKLRTTFQICQQGSFDYSYPFIEKANGLLSEFGMMSLLVPNSVFKNKSAQIIRNIIFKDLYKIYDFARIKVFSDALISTAIIVVQNTNQNPEHFFYEHNNEEILLDKAKYLLDKWVFVGEIFEGIHRFGDMFRASFSCATLFNDAFRVSEVGILENQLLKSSGSPKTLKKGVEEYIIFPYLVQGDELQRISENDLQFNYPNVYNHLLKFKNDLEKTDKDKNSYWYEFGRTQGIKLSSSHKLLMSPIVTNTIHLYELPPNSVPYSGIVISALNNNNLNLATQILTSQRFLRYVHKYGISRSGSSVQIGTVAIENYKFNLEE